MRSIAPAILALVLCFAAYGQDSYNEYLKMTKRVAAVSIAGDHDAAGQMAKSLLAMAAEHSMDWNYGNAVHVAHIALGRRALAAGDIKEAEKELLLSVAEKNLPYGMTIDEQPGTLTRRPKWKASPGMDSFGPDMYFAEELLVKGQKDAVLKYFDLCDKFWTDSNGRLATWRKAVEAGEKPDFGPNTIYFFHSPSTR